MNLTELFIRRPVLSIVVSLLIFLVGLQGAINLAMRQYPKVEETVITVTTAYPGANAELIQGFVSDPIAKAVSSTENVDYVTSSSVLGSSSVVVHMRLNADPDKALTEVLTKVQTVRSILPQESEDPVVVKGTGLSLPLMFLSFSSATLSQQQIAEYLQRVVTPRLATLPGVADAHPLGAPEFAMRIWLDPVKLAAHKLTAADVSAAVQRSNFLSTPGKVQSEVYAFAVQTNTTLRTPETFGMIPVQGAGDSIVRLRDIATIALGPENYDQGVLLDQGTGVFIGIYQTPSANPLEVAEAVQKIFPSIVKSAPPGLHGKINFDGSETIRASINEVFKTIGEAVVIVILVILVFLGSWRAVLIPTVTIPLSLVGVCFILVALGFSINLLTLLAMVLAIGLVVDDAIVVVENVHRHIELGQTPMDAAVSALKEIFGPLIAMTITLAAVYAPIGFIKGLTGTLFREFAFALAGSVIISGIVALTLSPMMSSRLLRREDHEAAARTGKRSFWKSLPARVDHAFAWVSHHYTTLLRVTIASRRTVLLLCAFVLVTLAVLFVKTPHELAPVEDEGFVGTMITAPRYATSNYTMNVARQFAATVGRLPEVKTEFGILGFFGATNTANYNYVFKSWGERHRSAAEIAKYIQSKASTVPGAQFAAFAPPSLPGTRNGLPVQYVIRGVGNSAEVFDISEKILHKVMATGKFFFAINSATYDFPQAHVEVDRDRAAALGVSISEIGTTLSVLMSEGWIARFDRDNRSYKIIPQVDPKDRFDPHTMERFYVRSNAGAMIPLSAVTKISTDAGPQTIEQFNQLNSATISAIPLPGMTVNDGIQVFRDIAKDIMPEGFFDDYTGTARVSAQEGNSLVMAFIFAIIVIYLVLAAQFESFRDPLIIMTAVPLSIFGAMVPLNLGSMFRVPGASLNIYTQLGLITLVGLIAKHGILLVQFANDERRAGKPLQEAILEAAHVRLRPILMTTAAMVMGVVPLLFASGAGAAARFSMGLVIASGMAVGTLFTLFVVPVFYTYISHKDVPVTQPSGPGIRTVPGQGGSTSNPGPQAAE